MKLLLIINVLFLSCLHAFPLYSDGIIIISFVLNLLVYFFIRYVKSKKIKIKGRSLVVNEKGEVVRIGDILSKEANDNNITVNIGSSLLDIRFIDDFYSKKILRDVNNNLYSSNYNYVKTLLGNMDIFLYSVEVSGCKFYILSLSLSKEENNPYFYWHFKTSPLGMVCFTMKGNITYWNDSSERLFGYSYDDVIGKNIVSKLNLNKSKFIEECKSCIRYGGSRHAKVYGKTKDGRDLICEWNMAPIYDNKKEIRALSAMVLDVTEKVYEFEYLEDLALRSTLIKDTTNLIIREDDVESIIYDALTNLHSYAEWSAYSVRLYDENRPTQFNTRNIWCANEEENHKEFVRKELIRPVILDEGFEGSVISLDMPTWIEEVSESEEIQYYFNEFGFKTAYFYPLNISGRPLGLVSMFCKDEKLQDDRISDLVEKIFYQVVVSIDRLESNLAREESIKIIDKKMMQSDFLYSSLNIMLDTNYDISDVMSILVNMLMTSLNNPIYACVKLIYNDNEFLSHEWTKPVSQLIYSLEVEGDVVGSLQVGYKENPNNNGELEKDELEIVKSLSSQISIYLSRIKTQNDLHEALVDAEQASQAKADFLASMSHEIRTPMNGVVGMIDLLQYTNMDEDQAQMVSTIRNSAFSLLQIINDILDFSKIEAGKLEIDNHEFDLYELLDDVGVIVSSAAINKKVRIYTSVENDVSRIMFGDSVRIRQILFNLIGNAIKFTGSDERQGQVHLYVKKDIRTITFSIIDNGIGMSKNVLDKLFTPFTQAESDTTRKYGGTGLGLSICKQLCELMDGKINVESKEGIGSAFNVTLPIVSKSDIHFDPPDKIKKEKIALCMGDETQKLILKKYLHDFNVDTVDCHGSNNEENTLYKMIIYDECLESEMVNKIVSKKGEAYLLKLNYFEKDNNADYSLSANPLSKIQIFRKIESILNNNDDRSNSRSKLNAPDKLTGSVLIAEDNITNQTVLKRQMELLGLDVIIANNGLEALNIYMDTEFDLILTDMHMPELDGLGLTKAVRDFEDEHSDHPRTPILAITANALENQQAEYLTKGIDEVVTKPIELEKLRACLFKWLNMNNDISDGPSSPELSGASSSENVKVKPTDLEDYSIPVDTDGPIDNSADGAVIESESDKANDDVINLQSLSDFVGDDPVIQAEILREFIAPTLDNLTGILKAAEHQNMEEASELGHKLKSAARLIGAVGLADACESLEKAGKEKNIEAVGHLSTIIEGLVKNTVAYIESFLAG